MGSAKSRLIFCEPPHRQWGAAQAKPRNRAFLQINSERAQFDGAIECQWLVFHERMTSDDGGLGSRIGNGELHLLVRRPGFADEDFILARRGIAPNQREGDRHG